MDGRTSKRQKQSLSASDQDDVNMAISGGSSDSSHDASDYRTEKNGRQTSNNEDPAHNSEVEHDGEESFIGDRVDAGYPPTIDPSSRRRPLFANFISNSGVNSASSVFKLQCEELVRGITRRYSLNGANDVAQKLKSVIEKAPPHESLPVYKAERTLLQHHGVAVPFPFPRPSADAKYQLAYSRPTSISIAGSHVVKTSLKLGGISAVDLVITMPAFLFSKKDYVNLRYFHKRAFYIACIAASIAEDPECNVNLRYECHHDNPLLPVLLVQPADAEGPFAASRTDINILLAIPSDLFPHSKLLPNRNCVRSRANDDEDHTIVPIPTPFYNASLCSDASIGSYMKLLNGAAVSSPGFRDACLLGRVWLRQRGFTGKKQQGGFGNFEWSAMVALLLGQGGQSSRLVLSTTYDAQQLFRATLHFLAFRDLARQPFVIPEVNLDPFDCKGVPMFFDSSRNVNILYKMSPWSYEALRQEAQTTIRMLSSASRDNFDSTFIFKVDEDVIRYDFVGRVPVRTFRLDIRSQDVHLAAFEESQDLGGILRRGLANRAKHVSVGLPVPPPWDIHTSRINTIQHGHLDLRIVVDAEHASRTVERGPPADQTKASSEFRQFWGSKTELRRFKDGQILESVVWQSTEPINLLREIIKHLLATHFSKESSSSFELIDNDLKSAHRDVDLSISTFAPIITTYKTLEKDMRALDGLPLQIKQIRPTGSTLCFSSIHPYQGPAEVVIQFEGSSRWPDDLCAIQMTKIAFLIKIAELLQESVESISTRVGVENESSTTLNSSFLEVRYPHNVTFHIRVHHERETTLSQRLLASPNTSASEREGAAKSLAHHKRNFEKRPAYTQALQILSTKYPALSPAIRLTKRWFNAHLLSRFFPSPLIETFVVRTFVRPYPWQTPSTPSTALLRTLLFLSRWNWESDPLIVDFASPSLKPSDVAEIETRFQAWRKIDPSLNRVALFVATNFDRDGTTWTEYNPSKVVAARMSALARAASDVVRDKGLELRFPALFKPSLKDYDFLVWLKSRFTRQARTQRSGSQFKNLASSSTDAPVGPQLIQLYLQELQTVYSEAALFFYDADGGNMIAGVWNPSATAGRRWKINLAWSTVPQEETGNDEGRAVINKDAILHEIARLGGDMVASVKVLKP